MDELKEIVELLNPWWKEGKVREDLARSYKREKYSEVVKRLDYRQIIILTGLRRVGKTTLLYQNIEHVLKKVDSTRVLYFNFDKKTHELTEILDDYTQLTNMDWKKEKIFVFLDEVSKLDDWASKVKLIYDAFPNIKFLVSSSSSIGLEEAAVKNLAGRYFKVNLPPLSFTEYLELTGNEKFLKNPALWEKELEKEVEHYAWRSFPELIDWKDKLLIKDYLRTTIIDKIVKIDLPDKFDNVNKDLLFKLLELFYSEPGMYLEYDSLSKNLGISKKTLIQHIAYLEFSYLIRKIRNFRVSTLASSRKLQRAYPYWWTLAYCYTDNADRILENMIGSTMNAKNYWRKNEKEIDFLKIDGKTVIPIEVKNKKELKSSDSKNMKYFLTKYTANQGILIYKGDEKETALGQRKKIQYIPLWKWLLEQPITKPKGKKK